MKENKIKLGIVGLGAVGNRIIQMIDRLNLSGTIAITAVCDVNEQLAKEVSTHLGGIEAYTDYNQMLEDAQIDVVYIAAPPMYHHDIVLKAIHEGKHLFCEKPLANSLQEAREMALAANQSGLVHAMHFPLNYGPALYKFHQLIEEGYLGELRRINLTMHFPQWPRAWQQNTWVAGRKQGGYVLEVGVHWIQVIQKLFGQITHVQSELQFPSDPELCENGIVAKMKLANGVTVYVDGLSQIPGDEHLSFTVYGTEGALELKNWGTLFGGKIGEPMNEISLAELPSRSSIMHNLIDAIQGKHADIYDFNVGFEAQVVLEALRNPISNNLIDIREEYRLS